MAAEISNRQIPFKAMTAIDQDQETPQPPNNLRITSE
jgi:hypothetical protein